MGSSQLYCLCPTGRSEETTPGEHQRQTLERPDEQADAADRTRRYRSHLDMNAYTVLFVSRHGRLQINVSGSFRIKHNIVEWGISPVTKTPACEGRCCNHVLVCLFSCPQRKGRPWEAPSPPSRSRRREIPGCVSSGGQNRTKRAKKTWTVELTARNTLTETWTAPERRGKGGLQGRPDSPRLTH